MAHNDEDAIKMILTENLPGIDQDTIEYFYSLINETDVINNESIIKETLVPFIESYGIADSEENAGLICSQIFKCLSSLIMNSSGGGKKTSSGDEVQLLDKMINLSVTTQNTFSQTEQAALDSMWGFEKIRSKKNDVMESTESGSSAREERKAAKEQKKWLSELDSKFVTEDGSPVIDDENVQISNMTLPEYSSGRNEKDIQVNNISITFGGKLLLDGADIRIVYTRRYGLIGKNGVGKTTLLRHMASFDIEGFPRHHRILHVKQEVNSSSCKSVLEVVLESDVERTQLLARQKKLIALQQTADSPAEVSAISEEMTQVYERLALIGSDSAESRAAAILSGLRFTESMQHSSTSKLSGGWLMRVALAAALFIEPDVLMLDEPTNHLDLEAVIWLQNYLLQYPHTILLVSHDRTFLNEVCTDMVLFKDLKLTYYRGNFDTYEKTRYELELLQKRQHEAQQAKLAHMQEFVDKFRYNANRAALVQSRIKTMNKEREELVEEVIDEAVFQFSFPDAGSLGSNVIKLQQVSFSYSEPESSSGTMKGPGNLLFSDVDMSLEQTSRIALVGPNGAGKSTLMNLIQGKLRPTEGFVNVNGQLRLAVFTQHHLDSFDLKLSPLHNMMQRWPLATEPELRAHLGNYEITGNDALKPMKFTSGGQKSRVAFACLTFTKPHVVLLDEPTNHLDMGAIGALIDALKGFSGGVLVISHDQHFIKSVCNEVWVVGGGRVKRFNGSFDDYKKSALESSKILAAQQQQQSKKK